MIGSLEGPGEIRNSRGIQVASDSSIVFIQHAGKLKTYACPCTEIGAELWNSARNGHFIFARLNIHAIRFVELIETGALFVIPSEYNGNKGITYLTFDVGFCNLISHDSHLFSANVVRLVDSKNRILATIGCYRIGATGHLYDIVG